MLKQHGTRREHHIVCQLGCGMSCEVVVGYLTTPRKLLHRKPFPLGRLFRDFYFPLSTTLTKLGVIENTRL